MESPNRKRRKNMDLNEALEPLKRWWWLIVLSSILAGASSFYAVSKQPPIYATRTTLIAGSSLSTLNPSSADLQLARQLATLYADVAQREPIRDATRQALDLSRLPQYTVSVPGNGQLIEIVVTDTDPQRAKVVADELAAQLIQRLPENAGELDRERQAFAEGQLDFLEEKITETEEQILEVQTELAGLSSAEQIAAAQSDLNALQTKLTTLQSNYAALLSTTNNQAVNTISVIEPADLPTRAVNSNKWLYILLSTSLGFVLSASAAYGLEYLDKSLKSEGQVRALLDAPVIARLPRISPQGHGRSKNAMVIDDEFSPEYETFRLLRANLEFGDPGYQSRSFLVVSSTPGDGKSTVAVNLAHAFARSGKRTVIVDADLRRPGVHRPLGVGNIRGLSDLLYRDCNLQDVLEKTEVGGLWAVPTGRPPTDSQHSVNIRRMEQVIKEIGSYHETMIIDGPPLIMADASLLASSVDKVVVVVRLNHTPKDALLTSFDQLRRAGANVAGIVINDASGKYSGGYLYEGYGYFGPDTDLAAGDGTGAISALKNQVSGWFGRRDGADQQQDVVDIDGQF